MQAARCKGVIVYTYACCVLMQGLSDAVVRRMYQWHFDPSCTILLDWRSYDDTPDLSIEDLGSGIEAALRQLSPMLMPGSVVTLHRSYNPVGWEDWISTVCAAVAAAAPTMPHVTVLAPCVEGSEKAITVLGQQDPPVQHACINGIHRLHGVSHTPWPWQSLTVTPVVLSELLELPDPRGGVYDIRLSVLCAYYSEVRTLACIECLGFVRLSSKLDGRQCTVAGSSEVSTPSYMRCIFMF